MRVNDARGGAGLARVAQPRYNHGVPVVHNPSTNIGAIRKAGT